MLKAMIWLVVTALAFTSASAAETYEIDNTHTYANFKIDHLKFSTMHGQLTHTSGAIVMDRQGDGSRVEVTIKPSSVYTGNKARDKKLRAMEGFFEVDRYPEIHYKSSHVQFQGKHKARVQGQLTMHGITQPVTLHVSGIRCGKNPIEKTHYTCGFDAHTKVKRSAYGMTAFLPLVGDTVYIMLEVEADRPLDT